MLIGVSAGDAPAQDNTPEERIEISGTYSTVDATGAVTNHTMSSGFPLPSDAILTTTFGYHPDTRHLKLKISPLSHLPPARTAFISTLLAANPRLLALEAPAGFFTDEQNAAITQRIFLNITAQTHVEQVGQLRKIRWNNFIAAAERRAENILEGVAVLSVFIAGFMAASVASFAGIVVSTAASYFLIKKYMADVRKYDAGAIANFNNTNLLTSPHVPEEAQALKAGLEATTWKGYLTSWQLATMRQPAAFRAGMTHALNEDTETVNRIRALP